MNVETETYDIEEPHTESVGRDHYQKSFPALYEIVEHLFCQEMPRAQLGHKNGSKYLSCIFWKVFMVKQHE